MEITTIEIKFFLMCGINNDGGCIIEYYVSNSNFSAS